MTFKNNIMSAGQSALAAESICGNPVNVTAAGTLYSNATLLTSDVVRIVSAVPGSGVRLDDKIVGDWYEVANATEVTVKLYPQTGTAFMGSSANTAIDLPARATARCRKFSSTEWSFGVSPQTVSSGGGSSGFALVEVPLSTTTGWTFANSPPLSVAAINTGLERVTYTCTAGGSGDGYAKYPMAGLVNGFDGSSCELIARFVGFTNPTLTQTYARIGFEHAATGTGFYVLIRGDARVEWGHMDSSSLVFGGNTFASAIPVDGTGWVRLRVQSGLLFAAFGQGTASEPPAAADWKMCRQQSALLEFNGENCPDGLNVGGSQSTVEAVDITVSFDNIFVRRLS